MMFTAAVDIGTNSMRFMLCEVKDNHITYKNKEIIVTRIGRNISKTGMISEKSIAKNIEALKYYKNKADRHGAQEIYAIATSAVREALNGEAFVADALSQTGVIIKVISGEEEADLGLKGVLSEVKDPDENILVIDIGGGSTELILGSKGKTDYTISIPAGMVKMTEQFVKGNPISCEEVKNMENRLNELFMVSLECLNKKKIDSVVAIGGTATTIAAMFHELSIYDPEIVHNTKIDLCYIDDTFNKLKNMSLPERRNVKGLRKERADVMPAGLCILMHVMKTLKKDSLIISENDNLEGIIMKYVLGKKG